MAEPTIRDLYNAVKEEIGEDSAGDILTFDNLPNGLEYVFMLLSEAGIKDPEEFLISKGILEKNERRKK